MNPINMLVFKAPPARYHGVLYELGVRPAKTTPNWYIVINDNRPGARENKIRLADRINLYNLDAEWRPMRRRKPRQPLSRRRQKRTP